LIALAATAWIKMLTAWNKMATRWPPSRFPESFEARRQIIFEKTERNVGDGTKTQGNGAFVAPLNDTAERHKEQKAEAGPRAP
jgi:hypothetical protein